MDKVQGQWVRDVCKEMEPYEDLLDAVLIPLLDKVDVLLHIAASETDNEFLHDDIMTLLKDGFNNGRQ